MLLGEEEEEEVVVKQKEEQESRHRALSAAAGGGRSPVGGRASVWEPDFTVAVIRLHKPIPSVQRKMRKKEEGTEKNNLTSL